MFRKWTPKACAIRILVLGLVLSLAAAWYAGREYGMDVDMVARERIVGA